MSTVQEHRRREDICILGGTGFVGRRIAARLVEEGHQVRILTRRRQRHRDLLVLPTAQLVEGDVHDPVFLRRQFQGMDAVINLVGILNEKGRSGRGFARVHADLPAKVVEAGLHADVERLLHMSALNASLKAPSHYLRTKAMGENTVHRTSGEGLHVTSFRPSVIFGPHDSFTNRFAGLLRLSPGVFPLACPEARFQPVYVEDVARAFVTSLSDHKTFGRRYDLCGPTVYTLRELVAYIAQLLGLKTRIIGLGDFLSKCQAAVLEFVPGKPFSLDNYRSLQIDSVCGRDAREVAQGRAEYGAEDAKGKEHFPEIFGIEPAVLEQVAPGYLVSGGP